MLRLLFLILILPIENAWARPILSVEKSSSEGILFEVQFPASSEHIANDTVRNGSHRLGAVAFSQPSCWSPTWCTPRHTSAGPNTKSLRTSDGMATVQRSWYPVALLACSAALKHTLVVSPYQYDARRNALRVYTRLRVEIRFTGGRQAKRARRTAPISSPYEAFLNAEQAPFLCAIGRSLKRAQSAGMTSNNRG